VNIVLVSTYGGVFTIADRAKEDNVIVIDPLDCNNDLAALNENVFCLATETESIGTSLADHLLNNNQTKAGLLFSTKDNFMSLVAQTFKKRFVEGGGRTAEESFVFTDTDFKTQLLKLNEFQPDAIVFLGHDETGIAMKQARELGVTSLFMATGTITSPGLQEASGGAAEGAIFAFWLPSSENSVAKAFEEKFAAKVGRPPILPLTTHPAYDAMLALKEALPGAVKAEDFVATLKEKLYATHGIPGTTGEIAMAPDGGMRIKESVFRLDRGTPVQP
jgi:ABC-type branched-subunit amino acid transport system substrate-binding protein